MEPDRIGYASRIHGTNGAGDPIFRIVDLAGQVYYLTVPFKQSYAANVDATVQQMLRSIQGSYPRVK